MIPFAHIPYSGGLLFFNFGNRNLYKIRHPDGLFCTKSRLFCFWFSLNGNIRMHGKSEIFAVSVGMKYIFFQFFKHLIYLECENPNKIKLYKISNPHCIRKKFSLTRTCGPSFQKLIWLASGIFLCETPLIFIFKIILFTCQGFIFLRNSHNEKCLQKSSKFNSFNFVLSFS